MKKDVKNTVSESKPATPEQIEEYKRLKLRNEWIKMNEKRLDEIEQNKIKHVRLCIWLCVFNLIVSLIQLIL